MGLRSFCTYICSETTPLQRLAFAATICLRVIYVLFVLTAGWAYPGVHHLLGKIDVCDPEANFDPNSTSHNSATCTSLSPVINACLMSSVLSTFVIILHTVIDIVLRARGPMRYCCGDSIGV